MFVSWNWLNDYVRLDMDPAALADRLMMAGLNHEETERVGDDWAIHLEVTSNRPDCLGHLGIAREIAVLWDRPLTLPAAQPKGAGAKVGDLTSVVVENPAQCPRYTARVLRGVKVGPSPKWLVDRLATLGIGSINNIVDITNYVLMECGQPLHAFDLSKLSGRRIVVRQARAGETLLAINHKTYTLDPSMCVIADERRPVGLGGVMGGAETEVGPATSEILIESAVFHPLSIRNTARKLALHSDSSYRFERGLDPEGVDWASRRCCQLILELAGGELAEGVIDVGDKPAPRDTIVLRFAQLPRVLGIEVPADTACRILESLGNRILKRDASAVQVTPPSWRRDLTREIDLIEEVARVHGYDKIPEDTSVPMVPSHRTTLDRVMARVRGVMQASGYDEAMTLSAVEAPWSEAFSPWASGPALRSSMPVLRRADHLRRSLVPSLLGARQINESLANSPIDLFETASVYLKSDQNPLPREELMLALTSGGDFLAVKGTLEGLLAELNPAARLDVRPTKNDFFTPQRGAELHVSVPGRAPIQLGFLGEVDAKALKRFELRGGTTVAEVLCRVLVDIAVLVPKFQKLPMFPAITRDLNLVVDEAIRWGDLERTVQSAAGADCEFIEFQDVYRDQERLGAHKKSLLFRLVLRSPRGTLTSNEADSIRDQVVRACQTSHAAQLRA